MAVTPIEIFAPRDQGLMGMIGGATNILGQQLASVVQIGRDLANNAGQQERDFLREQRAEEQMAQRRAENTLAQANNERNFAYNTEVDNRNFSRRLFESDRDYDLRVANSARDAAMDTARLSFAAADASRADRRFALDEQEAQTKRDEITRERQYYSDILDSRNAAPVPLEGVPIIGGVLPEARASAESRSANATLRMKAADELQEGDALVQAARDKAVADAELDAAGGTAGGLTESERRMREAFQYRKDQDVRDESRRAEENEAEKRAERLSSLASDTDAFPSSTSYVDQVRDEMVAGGQSKAAAEKALAGDYEKATKSGDLKPSERREIEVAAAMRMTEDEFVNAILRKDKEGKRIGTVKEDVARKRRSFYRLVQQQLAGSAPAGNPETSPSPEPKEAAISRWLNGGE